MNCCRSKFRILIAIILFLAIVAQTLCNFDIIYTLNAMVPPRNESKLQRSESEICRRKDPEVKPRASQDLFEWDNETKGHVTAMFSVGSIFGTLVSIWIYDFFYLRIVFAGGLLMGALNSLLLPMMSFLGSTPSVMTMRFFCGFYTGIMVPGVAVATTTWFPVTERGRVQSFIMLGSNFGKLFFALSGSIIESLGWSAMFHSTGGTGVLVAFLCFVMYNDNPAEHPCVSEEEESLIFDVPQEVLHTLSDKDSIELLKKKRRSETGWQWFPRFINKFVHGIHVHVKKPAKRVKWVNVLTSAPYWATVTAHSGAKFINSASLMYTQYYLQNIHGYSLTRASLLTSIVPNVGMIFLGLLVGYLNDLLLSKGYRKICVRRGFGMLMLVSTLMFIVIPFLNCEQIEQSIGPLLALSSFRSGIYASVVPSYQDLSPTFHKSLLSLSWTITLIIGGVFAPLLMGYIGMDTRGQWRLIYGISAGISICSILVYVILVDVSVQSWDPEFNKPVSKKEKDEGEPWFTGNVEPTLYGIFKSTEGVQPKMAIGSSVKSVQKYNEFISIFRDVGFNIFLRKYEQLGEPERRALADKYCKTKME